MSPSLARNKVRVRIVQAIVPHYRVPVFNRLAQHPDLEVELWAGTSALGSLDSSAARLGCAVRHARVLAPRGLFLQPGRLAAAALGGCDVLVLPWIVRYPDLLPTLGLARARGVRTLLWGHGYSKQDTPLRRRVRNAIGRMADGCMFYSRTEADRCVAEGFDPDRVFVAPNALDQGPIRAAAESWLARAEALEQFRREHGLTKGRTALFVARIEPDKRLDLLLDAFALCHRGRPGARLVVVGSGSAEQAMRQRARALGVDDATLFLGALYGEERLAPWFLSAAVFAFPAAIGLSIYHAMGYGVPVLTSDDAAGHNPEIEALRPGHNGLTYRAGDAKSLAAELARI